MKKTLIFYITGLMLVSGCTQQKQASKVEELQKLEELHKSGSLTDEEFSKLKSEIIGTTKDDAVVEPQMTHESVDLGLPSGTLWATANIGANAPWDYGEYYAWGERADKTSYTWQNYKFSCGTGTNLKKYVTDSRYGSSVDNRTTLLDVDDVAKSQWGAEWRMPTSAEMRELKEACKWQWIANKNKNNGYMVTGPNGATLFLPAAGYIDGTENTNINFGGFYWSADIYAQKPEHAMALGFDSEKVVLGKELRYSGLPVRAVRSIKKLDRKDMKNL